MIKSGQMNLQASETSQETSDLREKRSSERQKMRTEERNKSGGKGGGQRTTGAMTKKRLKAWELGHKRALIS